MWGGEGGVRGWRHLIRVLPPLQTLHTQTHQEAGESFLKFRTWNLTNNLCPLSILGVVSAQPLRLSVYPGPWLHVPQVHAATRNDVRLVRGIP